MTKRPWILGKPYFPKHEENRMEFEGDIIRARDNFLEHRFQNLDRLLKKRYSWMNKYIEERESKLQANVDIKIVEIGCGAGFSTLYLKQKPMLTDATLNPWVDKVIDATNIDLGDNSVDILIAAQTIHHFYSPYLFFFEALRILKPNGYLLIQEINTSLMMRVLLRLMRHEGWSYDVNVFDPQEVVNAPNDLWSANCAVPWLLFENNDKFTKTFKNENHHFEVRLSEKSECFLFPLSGGVNAKTKMPRLPSWFLDIVEGVDSLLCKALPSVFALGRSIALQKTS